MNPGIEIADLDFDYRGDVALSQVSLRWPTGLVALLGPNGAGKSTLLKIISGAMSPKAGSVTVPPAREGVVLVPQEADWPGDFRVHEQLRYFAWARGVPKADREARVERALAETGLEDRAGSRLSSLSGGMRQRAYVASALVSDPGILLLDEPSAGLDPRRRVDLRALFSRLAEDRTVVVSTHIVEDVAGTADWVTVLDLGGVAFDGTMEELTAQVPAEADGQTGRLERAFLAVTRG